MKKRKYILFLLGFTIAILASACGGDSGSPGDGGGNNPPSGDLNPGLSGKLFFLEKTKRTDGSKITEAWAMDIATGKYTKIPNTNWGDQEDRFPGNWDGIVATPVDYDGTVFVVTIEDCKNRPDYTCIFVQDTGGNYLGQQLEVLGDGVRSARMSQGRQHIALFDRDGWSVNSDRWLEIYDQSGGDPLSRSKLDDKYVFELEWLSDGRIVYSIRRTLYFTAPYSAQVENTKTLPDNLQGEEIGSITVSPDGERLAFTVDGIPYIMNIDGTRIRKLAIVGYKEEPGGTGTNVNGIAWSPDGQWILLAEGEGDRWTPSPPPIDGGASKVNYVVPAEYLGKIFNLESSPEVRILRRYRIIEESIDSSVTDEGFYGKDIAWLP